MAPIGVGLKSVPCISVGVITAISQEIKQENLLMIGTGERDENTYNPIFHRQVASGNLAGTGSKAVHRIVHGLVRYRKTLCA